MSTEARSKSGGFSPETSDDLDQSGTSVLAGSGERAKEKRVGFDARIELLHEKKALWERPGMQKRGKAWGSSLQGRTEKPETIMAWSKRAQSTPREERSRCSIH
jgi:hypothetical protein